MPDHAALRPSAASDPPLTVALIGNPNTGKSTLFTALAGIPTRVGNYPGVTVEEKLGRFRHRGRTIELIDLPGTYSLVPKSPDEQVAVDVLHGRMRGVNRPDVVVVVADATNLVRNLYLASQVLEAGLPTILALTLSDIADRKGLSIDTGLLATRLGCPVVRVVAPSREGIDELGEAILAAPGTARAQRPDLSPHLAAVEGSYPPAAREAIARYAWIDSIVDGVITRREASRSVNERIDAVLTHRLWGTLIFALTMLAIFTSIFWLAAPLMDLMSGGVDAVAGMVEKVVPEGAVRSLVVDGILAGFGGVVVFLPQIAMLFLFIAILEGCGYLARAAYLMDRLLVGVGLSGKSFIPLLSSFACAIPGIMAARTIENRRDRLLTILVAPLMSCSARLPVYLLLTAAFVPNVAVGVPWLRLPAVVLAAMYAIGVVVAAVVALILSRTVFRGPPQPFVLELPGWRWPQPAVVLERVREAAVSFLKNAGTLIVAVSIVVWALGSYPKVPPPEGLNVTEADVRGEALRQSFLGRAGRLIEPIVRPLGWDWRIGCAAIASFPAREVVLGTLGVIYNLGDVDPGEEEGATELIRLLKAATWDGSDRKVFTLPVALSIMVFFALCAQCASTLVIIGKETNSWIWPVVTFAYMTVLAWLGAFATYQIGTMILG
ncbi:MAG: ferrous iron transporter B [Planctomycetia bacterium]